MSWFLRQSPLDYQFARVDVSSSNGFLHQPNQVISGQTLKAERLIHQKLNFQSAPTSKKASIFDVLTSSFSSKTFKASKGNKDFFRKDALLWLFIITTRDDHSLQTTDGFIRQLRQLKKRGKYPNVFISTYTGEKKGCSSKDIKASSATKIAMLSSHFMNESYSICRRISFLTDTQYRPPIGFYRRFHLLKKPIPDSIKVSLNHVVLPMKTTTGKIQWNYHEKDNRIELLKTTRPGDLLSVNFLQSTSP